MSLIGCWCDTALPGWRLEVRSESLWEGDDQWFGVAIDTAVNPGRLITRRFKLDRSIVIPPGLSFLHMCNTRAGTAAGLAHLMIVC